MTDNDTDKKLMIIVLSFINGSVAMAIASAVVFPIIFVGLSITSGSFSSAMNNMISNWDVYGFICFIGLMLEISDRIYIGVKKNKVIKIIRDKEDRW
ncbi:hypothetical protein [Rheinheimera texasensis]|uniref:hypothetical protein n=1 Tax=Rheinheimera texasensis TaxID=306205 RepID=UPI0004E15E0C|nr:hypothetical protein [Rheinheimera texasensis]